MACGTPILVVAGGESARIIKEAQCGFVCEQDADKVADMVKNDILSSNDMDKMRINAKKYFDAHFTIDLLVTQLEQMIAADIAELKEKQ